MPDKLAKVAKSIVGVQTAAIAKHRRAKSQKLKVLLSEFAFALRLGIWLCLLPIFLRLRPFPALLQRFTLFRRRSKSRSPLEMDRAVEIVMRLCQMRLFYLPIFPRPCLRQALALYHVLTRIGYSVEIHFGIHKQGKDLQGHSWVTIQGKPVAERTRTEIFKSVYSYPSASYRSPLDETTKFQDGESIQTRR
jgi:Transglutaminase-like superfamily